jgi:hypothetical protein
VLLLLFMCVVFAASPASVCGCRSFVLALVFPHFGGSPKLLIFKSPLFNETRDMHILKKYILYLDAYIVKLCI